MIKSILSILFVIIFAAGIFSGCGADKVADKMTGASDIQRGKAVKKQIGDITSKRQSQADELDEDAEEDDSEE